MGIPGPVALARGIVVRAGQDVPEQWRDRTRVVVDEATLADPVLLDGLVDRLHRAWVGRESLVVEWAAQDEATAAQESIDLPPWDVDPAFLFPLERLRFLAFSNNYDARDGEPKWWWTVKAARAGVSEGGPADGLASDGTPVWIDGGPRQALDPVDHPIVHGDTAELGRLDPVSPPVASSAGGLAADQLEAVCHHVGPARIIAPAGSGKTRTLVARLRHLLDDRGWDEEQVMVLAYNRRAADELVDRLGIGRRMVRTIHSLGWEILQEARPGLSLMEERDVRNLVNRMIRIPRRANADPVGPYIEAFDTARIALRDPEVVEAERDDVPGLADAFDGLRERMYRAGSVDHGEQIYGAIEALLRDPGLRARWQARCRHLLVDEFQDLTPAYLLLIRLVASPQLDVFGVGDDDQVIYGYAGADPGYLIEFDRLFPGAGEHALSTNYRCPADVVEAASTLLGYNRRRIEKTITAARSDGDGLEIVEGDAGLAASAAEHIERVLAEGAAPSDIAALTRVNASLIPLKAALGERGIPTNDLLAPDSLQRTAVRALFAWIRLGRRPDEMGRNDLIEAVRRPSRGLATLARDLITRRTMGLDDLAALGSRLEGKQAARWDDFVADLEQVADAAESGTSASVIDVLLDRIGLVSSARTLDSSRSNAARSGHVDDLVAVRRAAHLHPDLATFQAWLTDHLGRRPDPGGVTLSSVHRVKGMEWPHVVVFGADRGAMPHDLAIDFEEERRVFHVALTRAIDKVSVYAERGRATRYLAELAGTASRDTAAEQRKPAGRIRKEPSMIPVADDLVTLRGGIKGTVERADGTTLVVRLDTGATLEAKVREVVAIVRPEIVGFDQQIFEALRMWRREVSQDRGVPAYVIIHDRTMEEIAARKPTSELELSVISGIGPAKLAQYGDEILAVVEAAG